MQISNSHIKNPSEVIGILVNCGTVKGGDKVTVACCPPASSRFSERPFWGGGDMAKSESRTLSPLLSSA